MCEREAQRASQPREEFAKLRRSASVANIVNEEFQFQLIS